MTIFENYNLSYLLISKFLYKNTNSQIRLKNGFLTLTSTLPFKYNYKNLLWFFFLMFQKKPIPISTNLRKNMDNEKTTLTGLQLSFNNHEFSSINKKLTNVILPNLESIFLADGLIKHQSALFSYKNCLSYKETESIEQRKNLKYISKFSINFTIKFNTFRKNEIFFFFDFFNFPILFKIY